MFLMLVSECLFEPTQRLLLLPVPADSQHCLPVLAPEPESRRGFEQTATFAATCGAYAVPAKFTGLSRGPALVCGRLLGLPRTGSGCDNVFAVVLNQHFYKSLSNIDHTITVCSRKGNRIRWWRWANPIHCRAFRF